MPRQPLIISILLLVGFGFMLVGGWSSRAWAAEREGRIVEVIVAYRAWESGRRIGKTNALILLANLLADFDGWFYSRFPYSNAQHKTVEV
jgi:hypothetical protein